MSQQKLLEKVVFTLNRLSIEYMVTGSIASSLQGEPRSTHDIDLIIGLPKSKVPALIAAFPPPDYYLDQDAVLRAVSFFYCWQARSPEGETMTESGDFVQPQSEGPLPGDGAVMDGSGRIRRTGIFEIVPGALRALTTFLPAGAPA